MFPSSEAAVAGVPSRSAPKFFLWRCLKIELAPFSEDFCHVGDDLVTHGCCFV